METALRFLDDIHDKKEYVLGEIYKISNKVDGKSYIGQTVSHRMNHGRYRPFGFIRRFKSHVSEAVCNNKKHQCSCLSNAIRKYGVENFDVSLLGRYPLSDIDKKEQELIADHLTLYPNGYNLALGGNMRYRAVELNDDFEVCDSKIPPTSRHAPRKKETVQKIIEAVKKFRKENDEYMEETYRDLKNKRDAKKLALFEGVSLQYPLEQYIFIRKRDDRPYAKVIVGKHSASFDSQYETLEESKKRAIQFLKQVEMNNSSTATLPN